jgi:multidrug efflux pump subunit AcrB
MMRIPFLRCPGATREPAQAFKQRHADATIDLLADAPQFKITINRGQVSRFGVLPKLIDDTLNDAPRQR